jgi:hypothetical protein
VHARVVHKNVPHDLRCQGKKMCSTLPIGFAIHQAQISFMNQGGWLEGVIVTLSGEVFAGNAAQFIVDERNQGIARCQVALIPTDE